MHAKIILALCCAVLALLIEVNHGAPAGPRTVPAREDPTAPKTIPLPESPSHSRTVPLPGPGSSSGSKTVPATQEATGKRPMPGARMAWSSNFDKTSKRLFNKYKSVVTKKLRAAHRLPTLYTPKPAKYATQLVAGTLYHYLVKVPGNKYAHVTISHQPWLKGKLGSEDNVNVRPQLYGINEVL